MKKALATVLVVIMIAAIFTPTLAMATPQHPFTDVGTNTWYSEAVDYVWANNLMRGTGANTFSPNSTMSRAMVATILYRLADEPSVSFAPVFTDVSAGSWYANAVIWANTNNIVQGVGGGRFAPNADVTREQFVTLLFRFAMFLEIDTSVPMSFNLLQFEDRIHISSWAQEPMLWAAYHGLITGTSITTLSPSGTATRAQCATILHRFSDLLSTPTDPDIPTDPPIDLPPNATDMEWQMFLEVNQLRTAHGAPPLAWCNCLRDVALAHSFDMWQRDFHGHTNPDGIGPGGRIRNAGIDFIAASENVASGFRTFKAANAGFMESPIHRDTLLSPGWTHIGIGHWDGGGGSYNGLHWTQKFIRQPDHVCR